MKLIAEQRKFVEIFTTMNMNGLFNPIVMDVKKTIITMVGRDPSDIALTSQKFKGVEIEGEAAGKIIFDPEEMLNAFKLFTPEDKISINVLENTIVVSNADDAEINDVVSIPQIDINTFGAPEFPFKIVKGLPIITNKVTGEQVEFLINATIPVKYLAELVKRANYVDINPRVYKLIFEDNKLKGVIGNAEDFQKSVTTTVNITGEGSGELLFGSGLEEMIKTLSGDITINALTNTPAWFTMKSDDNIVHVLIAPATIE